MGRERVRAAAATNMGTYVCARAVLCAWVHMCKSCLWAQTHTGRSCLVGPGTRVCERCPVCMDRAGASTGTGGR